ncbi:MAG TPA: hypothetical protein VIY07_16790, partial [Pseudolabrys sp.]
MEPWWADLPEAPYVAGWQRFLTDTGFAPHLWEQPVYNDTYQYKGRYDVLGTVSNHEALIDIKTTVQMAPSLGYQLAGYDLCLPPNPKRIRWGVQLKKDGGYQLHEYGNRNDHKIFLAASTVAQTKGLVK